MLLREVLLRRLLLGLLGLLLWSVLDRGVLLRGVLDRGVLLGRVLPGGLGLGRLLCGLLSGPVIR